MTGGAPVARGPRRVLVVDDDALLRAATCRMLRHLGHDAEGCASAADALRRLADAPFDLVLTDERMPGTPGTALACRVRARHPGVQVVLVSGALDVDPSDLPEGVHGILAKPFRLDTLRALLARLGDPT